MNGKEHVYTPDEMMMPGMKCLVDIFGLVTAEQFIDSVRSACQTIQSKEGRCSMTCPSMMFPRWSMKIQAIHLSDGYLILYKGPPYTHRFQASRYPMGVFLASSRFFRKSGSPVTYRVSMMASSSSSETKVRSSANSGR